MTAEPRSMTPQEIAWVRRLRRVMAAVPPGLELLTMGDRELDVIDKYRAHEDLHDGRASANGIVLATVSCAGCRVHGVSG